MTNQQLVFNNDDGSSVTLDIGYTYTPPPPPPIKMTRYGETPDTLNGVAGVDSHIKLYPVNNIARVYGQSLASWADPTVVKLRGTGARLVKSAKTASLSNFTADWDAIPTDVDEVLYTYYHEINRPAAAGVPTKVQWLAFFDQLVAARNAHRNKAKIKLGPIFSWYPAAIGNNQGIIWSDLVTPDADYIGWDQYNPTSKTLYDTAKFTQLPIQSGRVFARRVLVTEIGVQRIDNDTNDTQATAWLDDVTTIYDGEANVTDVIYWCGHDGTNPDWHLDNRPNPLNLWKGLMQR